MTDGVLLIFAKAPVMGGAKTRLARDIGATQAQRLNRFCHAQIMRAASKLPQRAIICTAPDSAVTGHFGGLWPLKFDRKPQGGGDLGDRLARAFAEAPPGPVIVVGTDAPQINSSHLAQAFKALKRSDVVVGPADDGGFWLLGLSHTSRRYSPFFPVRWSTEYALQDVLNNLPGTLRIERLSSLIDLDDAAALNAWKTQTQNYD